jgi:U3 small nucleolar RNA-associated protein 14
LSQIGEIFADDDLVAEEFEAEKLAAKRRQQKQKVEVALPGWGCWSGEERKGRRKRGRPLDKVKLGVKMAKVEKPPPKKDNWYVHNQPFNLLREVF